ncbi:hypothetical protein LG299_10780 [Microbacterium lacus]|uniref:hypothetical protein n=1 Tax=Microbacterium lacus TaxID=415217 RepID=UPI00384AB1F6
MSTEPLTRRASARTRRGRTFMVTFAIVTAVLAAVGIGAAAASVVQGPRVTNVSIDPEASVAASGSRVIFTTSQSLAEVDDSQVTVEPSVPFAVDTSGRSVGVRFGMPLHDDTTYTVTITGLTGIGGGPESTVTETFTTPSLEVNLAQRRDGEDDIVYRTDLTGEQAVAIFHHPRIEDFRATGSHLVMSVRDDDDRSSLIVTDLNGENARELPLPGDGSIRGLQAADRGEVIGYTFSDADLGEDGGLESVLFTASLDASAADAAPTQVTIAGADPRVADWRFVPDTDSILVLGFDANLLLAASDGSGATSLGSALAIQGIAGTDAIVDRMENTVVIDLTDGSEAPLVEADTVLGLLGSVLPVPGGGTLRTYATIDDAGAIGATQLAFVDSDGVARVIGEVPVSDAYLQTCVSPSGRYAALLVAPDAVSNPYDLYPLPLPANLETQVVEIDDGTPVVSLNGFDISWCRVPPE